MNLSILVIKVMALVYLSVGLGILFNGAYYKKALPDILKQTGVMYLGGFMALVAGFFIVTYHNIWVRDWTVLITLIGWLALIKGVFFLMLPQWTLKLTAPMMKEKNVAVWGWVALILGLIFGYLGFMA